MRTMESVDLVVDSLSESEIEAAVARVQREPAPNPFEETWTALSAKHLRETHDELGA